MVAATLKPAAGMGLYTPQEAALYSKLRTETFNRWFYGDKRGGAVVRPRFPEKESRVVTFWDLMAAVAIRTVRTSPQANRITLQHVRSVVDECEVRNVHFPLARHHALYWFSNRLILQTNSDEYIGLQSGLDRGQLYQAKIIEPFLREVQFGEDDMAEAWTPLKFGDFRITLDANRRYGLPTIEPGGILVSALVDAVQAEGSIEGAAEAFDTSLDAVDLALKYQEYLQSAA
jgi:uncharacterized protein (DUF433 family)